MLSDNDRRGLCRTCDGAPRCTYPRDPEQPILQCEEYDSDAAGSEKTTTQNVSRAADPAEHR